MSLYEDECDSGFGNHGNCIVLYRQITHTNTHKTESLFIVYFLKSFEMTSKNDCSDVTIHFDHVN